MSFFDCISSTAYIFVSVFYPESGGFYMAQGSDFTCKLQGFMIQMGLASVFYNFGLSLYFLLVICYNWKEFRFRKYKVIVHIIVVTLGMGLAFGALPYYGPQFGVCYVSIHL